VKVINDKSSLFGRATCGTPGNVRPSPIETYNYNDAMTYVKF